MNKTIKNEKTTRPPMEVETVREVEKLEYLKAFVIDYKTKSGQKKQWELVSRQNRDRLESEIFQDKSYTDGAMVFATNEEKTKVVILKEYRVSAGKYVYMFPAGLVESGESIERASVREFKEETGMGFVPKYVERERYVSVGIINERVNIVYGTYFGQASQVHQEDNEHAEIQIIDKDQAHHILENEEVSIRTAMLLQGFFKLNPYFHDEDLSS